MADTDTTLIDLVAKCATARLAWGDATDRLEVAWRGRPESEIEWDPTLQALDAECLAVDAEYDALCLAVAITPSHSLEGALAKVAVLPDDDTLGTNIEVLLRRYADGLQRGKDWPLIAS
jgi:hypothetical protein